MVGILDLQSCRHGGVVHIAERRHVVRRYPLPKLQLLGHQSWSVVDGMENILPFHRRLLVVQPQHHRRVHLAAPEWHSYTHTNSNDRLQSVGHTISESAFEGKRKYHIGEFHITKVG